MSEDQTDVGEQRALTVVKERLIAHSTEPMWDSAAFDHMGRVASVMAESGLASDTLLNDNDGNPANPKTVVARMLLIAHMARECGANPLMFLQGCSRIGKKIHLEGKLVNAIVRARTGVNLRFQFGRWDTDRIELPELHTEGPNKGLPVDPEFFKGVGERLAVRVSDPEDPERHVEGSVGLWKTDRKGSPWTSQGNWRRQLRYRGAPEWARAYEPGAVLGIYSEADQDIDDIEVVAKPVGLMQRLKGEQTGDGFNAEDVAEQTKPKRKTKAERLAEEALAAAGGGKSPDAGKSVEIVGEPEEAMQEAEPAEVHEPPKRRRVEDFEEVNPTMLAEGRDVDDAVGRSTHAAPGEVYLFYGDGYNGDKRRVIYKDGSRFSTTHKDAESKYRVYAAHSPLPPPVDESELPEHMRDDVAPASIEEARGEMDSDGTEAACEQLADRPTETGSAQPAEPEPATSETATPASSDGQEPSDSGPSAEAESGSELDMFIDAVEGAGSWGAVKTEMAKFYNTDTFKELTVAQQNRVRAGTWLACDEGRQTGRIKDLPDHANDLSAFRLWLEAQEDPDAIKGTEFTLKTSTAWKAAPVAMHDAIGKAVAARLAGLG